MLGSIPMVTCVDWAFPSQKNPVSVSATPTLGGDVPAPKTPQPTEPQPLGPRRLSPTPEKPTSPTSPTVRVSFHFPDVKGPYPATVKEVVPPYPLYAISMSEQGTVYVNAWIDPDGHVRRATARHLFHLSGDDESLQVAAIAAAEQWEFVP